MRKKVSLIAAPASKQISTGVISIRKLMASKDFVEGFRSVREGLPFDYSAHLRASDWNYERGRLLATIYSGALKDGRVVTTDAIHAYIDGRQSGLII